MMNLIVLLVVVWVVVRLTRGLGVGCGFGRRGQGGEVERGSARRGVRGRPREESGGARSVASAGRRPALAPESPMERLQRRFVAGELTVEEYERELDRVLRV